MRVEPWRYALFMVALFILSGCKSPPPEVPEFDPEELTCIAMHEGNYRLRDKACGENTEGKCSTDWLIDRQKFEVCTCFKTEEECSKLYSLDPAS